MEPNNLEYDKLREADNTSKDNKSSSRKILIFSLIFMILVVSLLAGLAIVKDSKNKLGRQFFKSTESSRGRDTSISSTEIDTESSTLESGQSVSPNYLADPDESAPTKSYHNETLGLDFTHPADWAVNLEYGNTLIINSAEKQKIWAQIQSGEVYGSGGFSADLNMIVYASTEDFIGRQQSTVKKTIPETINNWIFPEVVKEIQFDGQKAYEYRSGGMGGIYYNIVCEYKGRLYNINALEDPSLNPQVLRIIESFKFAK